MQTVDARHQGRPRPYTYSVPYIRHFWRGHHKKYGHIRCIYTVLANPNLHTHISNRRIYCGLCKCAPMRVYTINNTRTHTRTHMHTHTYTHTHTHTRAHTHTHTHTHNYKMFRPTQYAAPANTYAPSYMVGGGDNTTTINNTGIYACHVSCLLEDLTIYSQPHLHSQHMHVHLHFHASCLLEGAVAADSPVCVCVYRYVCL